jgi:DNA-binding GntR family transcriptional regulator
MHASLEALLAAPAGLSLDSKRVNLKDQVIDLLRTHIVFGRIPVGTPLVERELAAILRMSRLPIREALQELEKEGLVVATATNRRQVITLTERDIRELYEVRLQLELLASTRAAARAPGADCAPLLAHLASMEQAFEQHDRELFPRTDISLHLAIWELADNQHLLAMLKTMSRRLFMVVSRHSALYDWTEVVELHRSIVKAIIAGDQARTRESIEFHMQNSLERTLKAFVTDPPSTPLIEPPPLMV